MFEVADGGAGVAIASDLKAAGDDGLDGEVGEVAAEGETRAYIAGSLEGLV
ncbi:MAG: hypothetical protein MUF49_06065 [Oculatellaceae cyanobacterium Prado106]|nr:hypothetical protein [Oculatellaceae cyanobacterium Prado106]